MQRLDVDRHRSRFLVRWGRSYGEARV